MIGFIHEFSTSCCSAEDGTISNKPHSKRILGRLTPFLTPFIINFICDICKMLFVSILYYVRDYDRLSIERCYPANGSPWFIGYKKATLSLVRAVAFLMLIFRHGQPDTDDCHDDAYNRDNNTDYPDGYL